MTDTSPAALRAMADECDKWAAELLDMEGGMPMLAPTLRALADQMEDWRPTNFDDPPGNWTEKAAAGAAAVVAAMTQPTIEAAAEAIRNTPQGAYNEIEVDYAKAAARVILSAEPSDKTIEAAAIGMALAEGTSMTVEAMQADLVRLKHENQKNYIDAMNLMRAAIKAALTHMRKEMDCE